MSTAIPLHGRAEMSPRSKARFAGAFYLATILLGAIAEGAIGKQLIAPSDAALTASNILARPGLFQAGFGMYLVELSCQVVMVALMYDLLRPVSRTGARLAAVFGYVGCTIKLMSRLFYLAPLLVLNDTGTLGAFTAEQGKALALLLWRVNDHGAAIAMIFFGLHAVVKGWLVMRSTFLPHALGLASIIGGAGWLTYLYQPLGYRAFVIIGPIALLASLANIIWLLWRGVDDAAWRAQALQSEASIWR